MQLLVHPDARAETQTRGGHHVRRRVRRRGRQDANLRGSLQVRRRSQPMDQGGRAQRAAAQERAPGCRARRLPLRVRRGVHVPEPGEVPPLQGPVEARPRGTRVGKHNAENRPERSKRPQDGGPPKGQIAAALRWILRHRRRHQVLQRRVGAHVGDDDVALRVRRRRGGRRQEFGGSQPSVRFASLRRW